MVDKEKLKIYREINNYNIKKLSRKLKIRASLIKEWENGESIIDEENLTKLCKLYNIDKECLLIKKKDNYLLYFLALLISLIIPTIIYSIFSDLVVLITNIICFLILFINLIYIKDNYVKEDIPKSLFNIKLMDIKSKRIKLYIQESIVIGSIYIIITNIFKVLSLDILVVNIDLISNRSVNDIVISFITYLLLTILTFIIELGFGEYIYKRVDKYGRE